MSGVPGVGLLLPRLLRWLPAAVAAFACAVILIKFGTPLYSIGAYTAYLLLAAVVPGTLLWRMLRIRPRSLLEETAAGTAVGLAIQALLTFALGRIGAPPQFAILWCIAVIVGCLAVPRLRPLWRSSATEPVSPWMSWALAAVSVVTVWVIANTGFRANPLTKVPGFADQYFAQNPYVDLPFHQSLAAGVLHGSDVFPYVSSVPLQYTLMVYEHLADFTRWTGVDLTLGLMRLSPVLLQVLAVVLCGVLAYRITRSPVAGALGGALAFLTDPASLYRGVHGPFSGVSELGSVYRSPTQAFGEPIFLVMILLVVIMLHERRARPWMFVMLAVLAFVCGGAKATFLPLIICGVGLALVVGWFIRARRTFVCLATLGIAAVAFVASLLLVDGTNSRGLEISDGADLISRMPTSPALGPIIEQPGARAIAISLVVAVWILGVIGAMAATILRRRDLSVWLLAGIGIAGIAAAILGTHPGLSQLYFVRSAWPVLGVLSAVGLAGLARRVRSRRRAWIALALSLILGFFIALVVRISTPRPGTTNGHPGDVWTLAAPFAVLIVIALVVGAAVTLVVYLLERRKEATRAVALSVGVLVVFGMVQGSAFSELASYGLAPLPAPVSGEGVVWGVDIPRDGAEAARWLRANSAASDTIVTNQHCLDVTPKRRGCDPRQFWISALAERNVLVEGWSYSTPSSKIAPGFVDGGPFWDRELLAANDAAIYQPSPQTVEWLRSHGVEWVFVDRSVRRESPELGEYLDLAFDRGAFAVYRVR